MAVETDDPGESGSQVLAIQMLGPLTIRRGGEALKLPSSRKMRALFAYLALAPHAVTRSRLCELLWDVPNDPRGELRWSLSKIRSVIDEPDRQRVATDGDTVRIDLTGCRVDALEVSEAIQQKLDTLPAERLRELLALFRGEFLNDVELERSPEFNTWLAGQRRRFRACHVALLEALVKAASDDDAAFGHIDRWLALSPYDQRAHESLLTLLARRGRLRDGDEHVAAAARLFETEGLDFAQVRAFWRAVRARSDAAPRSDGAPREPQPVQPAPASSALIDPAEDRADLSGARRASIAVMPFADRGAVVAVGGSAADGLAYDVITRLAKLRNLFVIAQGSVFALHERHISPEQAGRMLNVDYVVSGSLLAKGDRITVTVDLVETRSARVVWAEVFDQQRTGAFEVMDEIGNRIVASIASEIETIERNRAILRPPNSLDAWEAHHRGLWHMYRFSQADNERAQHFFKRALQLDPTFARAHAGLSFTHFQNAFQGWSERGPEIDRAYAAAGQALMADDRDPAAHWAMGRAQWLRGNSDQSVAELAQSVDLSPNFALAHYNLAFVHSTNGDPGAAIPSSDYSRDLSPFDPMLFGMLGARAMALVRLERFDEASEWAIRAAARPNAFAHIHAIAAYSLALAGRIEEARTYMATIRKTLPHYDVTDFLTAMQFGDDGAALFKSGAKRIG